jgi:nucleotide-binding universal stress UspA family protein
MGALCVVIDGLTGVTETQVSKLKQLVNANDQLLFVVNLYNPYFERHYILRSDNFKEFRQLYAEKIDKTKQKLLTDFSGVCKDIDIKDCLEKDLENFLSNNTSKFETVILSLSSTANRHVIYLNLISKITSASVIMLSQRGWPQAPLIAASVDPFHDNDRDGQIDKSIVSSAKSLVLKLKASFKLVHCRYIPTQLLEYAEEIRTLHENVFSNFSSVCQVAPEEVVTVGGDPESSLPSFVRTMGVDLLIVGLFARNSSSRKYIGSTTESLLRKAPCDLLFVNESV